MPNYDLIVVGAGVCGMTAALGAANSGIKKILLIERENYVGGIINQCIHNGFGEKFIGKTVTGPEYIEYLKSELKKSSVEILLNTAMIDLNSNKVITYVNPSDGVKEVSAGAIIFAMGAKEKYLGNVDIPTNTLTGTFTVGEAHRIINVEGYFPGKNSLIIAKDRWGFLVARRIIIEGGNVCGVIIEGPKEEVIDSEISNIIEGFDVPIMDNSKIVSVSGDIRIEKVKIMDLLTGECREQDCDSLIVSVSFIPENDKLKKLKIELDSNTLGPKVNEYKTSIDGFYACGNIVNGEFALHMDSVDGYECGEKAAEYIKKYII